MTSDVDFGVKLRQPIDHHQSLPFSRTPMMVLHANQHRPFDNGPTSSCDGNKPLINYSGDHIYSGGACCAAVGVRTLQPFETSETTTTTTASAFKSPGGNMAASLGFPFTNAQWKELERQAMIYKYMVSSIHVPPHLLIPPPIMGNGLDVGFTNRADLEPGRCRRTDGKKWRCSREVAPDQKYCERHMHRGRPRSRKHVELNSSNKKSRNNPAICTEFPVTAAISNSTIKDNHSGSASDEQTFGSTYREPRSSDWMLEGGTVPIVTNDQQWPQLVRTKIGIAIEEKINTATINSLFLDESPRGFIDAWSTDANSGNTSSVSSDGKLPLSHLSLSMGGNRSIDDEMGQIQMNLGLIGQYQNQECGGDTSSTPGGPLAEPPQSLHHLGFCRKHLRDSSDNSSPTLATSRAKPEIAMHVLNLKPQFEITLVPG
ncbi:GROWTH-REGULATING FACTOR 7 [Salix purpurea]|uniref:Growth-regulating factor n=1 Tax=Salix purpurea TaxID=77065 RepID=A0A9Q0W7G1_SALPP|nr:GROWTH-REGULATING FACTOR 7 [Salix purpurea]